MASAKERQEWFDQDFFTQGRKDERGRSIKGAKRDQDSPHYKFMAIAVTQVLGTEGSWLDIGCGMGWTVQHLRDCGVKNAEGVEISQWAVDNAVCEGIYHGDVVRLHRLGHENANLKVSGESKRWDRILCDRVLGYLEPIDAGKAIKALSLSLAPDGYLVCAIICSDHKSEEVRRNGAWGRKSLRSKEWYVGKFRKNGLVVDEEKTRAIVEPRSWDCVWVLWREEGAR